MPKVHTPRLGNGLLATNATKGFAYIPNVNGAPTGTPDAKTGFSPICFEVGSNKLWIYNNDSGYGDWYSFQFT